VTSAIAPHVRSSESVETTTWSSSNAPSGCVASNGGPASTTSVSRPSIGSTSSSIPDKAQPRSPGEPAPATRMPVPNSGINPSDTTRPSRCHGSTGPPTTSHSACTVITAV
jgi:hypothetical protein